MKSGRRATCRAASIAPTFRQHAAAVGRHHGAIRTRRHGAAFDGGNKKAPVCADCHTAHDIQRAEVSSWQLDVIRECGTCHEEKIKTYRDTFHGQVTSLGFARVATCAACHGTHILRRGRALADLQGAGAVHVPAVPPERREGLPNDPHADKHNRDRNPALYYASQFMTQQLWARSASSDCTRCCGCRAIQERRNSHARLCRAAAGEPPPDSGAATP
jgi:hypothetical protein